MITFTSSLADARVEEALAMNRHLTNNRDDWAYRNSRRHYNRPVWPRRHNANTVGFEITKTKLGFWELKGIEALRRLCYQSPPSFMDLWCFWRSRSDREQREIIWKARKLRTPWCQCCGAWIRNYEPSLEDE